MLIGRIVITTMMDIDGGLVHNVEAVDAMDNDLGLMESLGMIEMAKDSLLRVPPERDEYEEYEEDNDQ